MVSAKPSVPERQRNVLDWIRRSLYSSVVDYKDHHDYISRDSEADSVATAYADAVNLVEHIE